MGWALPGQGRRVTGDGLGPPLGLLHVRLSCVWTHAAGGTQGPQSISVENCGFSPVVGGGTGLTHRSTPQAPPPRPALLSPVLPPGTAFSPSHNTGLVLQCTLGSRLTYFCVDSHKTLWLLSHSDIISKFFYDLSQGNTGKSIFDMAACFPKTAKLMSK